MSTTDSSVTKTITVSFDSDMAPSQMAAVCRACTVVLNALAGNILTAAGREKPLAGGAGHPITQQIFAAAVNLETAAVALEGPSRVALGGPMPHGSSGRA